MRAIRHPAIKPDKPPPLLWFIAFAVIVLAITVIAGGLYLNARRAITDTHQKHTQQDQQLTQQAICTILNALPPPSKQTPAKEHSAFVKAYRLEQCTRTPAAAPSPKRSPRASPKPARAAPVVRPSPVVITRTSHPVIHLTTHPTVTKTETAKPKPTHTPHHKPTPEPSQSCLLGIKNTLTCHKK